MSSVPHSGSNMTVEERKTTRRVAREALKVMPLAVKVNTLHAQCHQRQPFGLLLKTNFPKFQQVMGPGSIPGADTFFK